VGAQAFDYPLEFQSAVDDTPPQPYRPSGAVLLMQACSLDR
jgi:hypothetical protein